MTDYQTLFDAAQFGYGTAAFRLLLAAFLIWLGLRRLRNAGGGIFAALGGIRGLVMMVVAFGLIVSIGREWWQSIEGPDEGSKQVEGHIYDHWIKQRIRTVNGQDRKQIIEHFGIGGIDFEFAQTNNKGSYFTNAAAEPVKLQNGMQLCVAYVEDDDANKIVQLEVAR